MDVVAMLDVVAVIIGVALPAVVYSAGGDLAVRPLAVLQTGLLASLILFLSLRAAGLYDTTRVKDLPIQPGTLASGLGLSLAAVLGVGMPFEVHSLHFWMWCATWLAAAFCLLLANRIAARHVLGRMAAAGRFDHRIAVFGVGEVALRVHQHLTANDLGIRLVGVYDDRVLPDRIDTKGLAINGRLEDLLAAGRRGDLDQIVIALPAAADARIAGIVRKLEHLPVSVHVVTHLASDRLEAGAVHRTSRLGSVGLLDVKRKALSDWAAIVKRAEDYVLGLALMLILAPVMALIALAIRLDSPGSVLFTQNRRGLNGRTFRVFKFRTMTVSEDGPELRPATANDNRVTRVGRFLRRTSLDELPQLFNVLRGEMSLVGPRPHALVQDDEWSLLLERYANRHEVKPGLTGLAQVRGLRGPTDTPEKIEQRVAYDLEYIAKWSLWLDFVILARTAGVVIKGENAH